MNCSEFYQRAKEWEKEVKRYFPLADTTETCIEEIGVARFFGDLKIREVGKGWSYPWSLNPSSVGVKCKNDCRVEADIIAAKEIEDYADRLVRTISGSKLVDKHYHLDSLNFPSETEVHYHFVCGPFELTDPRIDHTISSLTKLAKVLLNESLRYAKR